MNNKIDTKSWLFKLYADRLIRNKGNWISDMEDVVETKTNICHYVRNIALQVGFRFMVAVYKFIGGLIVSLMVLVPILSIGFWLFTDNGFIVWLNELGKIILTIDAAILFLFGAGCIHHLWTTVLPQTKWANHSTTETLMTPFSIGATWIRSAHGKFCVPLTVIDPDEPVKGKSDDDDKFKWPGK